MCFPPPPLCRPAALFLPHDPQARQETYYFLADQWLDAKLNTLTITLEPTDGGLKQRRITERLTDCKERQNGIGIQAGKAYGGRCMLLFIGRPGLALF